LVSTGIVTLAFDGRRSRSSYATGASFTGVTVIASGQSVSAMPLSVTPTVRLSGPL